MSEENKTTEQAAQELVNGGITSVSAGQRSTSFIPLKELDDHAKEVERKVKGRDPASGIRAYRMSGGTPRY